MPRILIIDDDKPTRAALRAILEPAGYDVLEAPNGEVGVRLYREEPFDLVTTNIVMPEKDGLETIRELKNAFPEIKIIVISGYDRTGRQGYLTLAKEYGALQSFQKPLDLHELLDAVDELLDAGD